MGEGRSTSKILTNKPTGKKLLGRPRPKLMTMLEWMLIKQVLIQAIGLIELRIGNIGEPL